MNENTHRRSVNLVTGDMKVVRIEGESVRSVRADGPFESELELGVISGEPELIESDILEDDIEPDDDLSCACDVDGLST